MKGTKRITKVAGKFIGLIKQLGLGVSEVTAEIETDEALISSLAATNKSFKSDITSAEKLIAGLTKLVNGE